jgi:hypothetical protein
MTTCEWIYVQTCLTERAVDHAHTPEEREFLMNRLHELQGRVQFEQRMLARSDPDPSAIEARDW